MIWQYSSFGLLYLLVTLISAGIIYRAWRRSFPGNTYFLVFMDSAFIWALTGALEWFVIMPEHKAFWSRMSYFGIVNVAPSWFCFSLAYAGYQKFLTKRNVVLIWIIPFVTLLIALTNRFHGWNWPDYQLVEHPLGNYMFYHHGPSFWVLTAYSYLLNIISSVILFRHAKKLYKTYRIQSIVLYLGVLAPWIGNILYNTRIISIIDLTPISFTITGALIWWNMKQYHLFDLTPIARDILFTQFRQIAIVLDSQGRILDMNPYAVDYFNLGRLPIGKPVKEVFSFWPEFSAFLRADNIAELEIKLERGETPVWFLIARTPLVAAYSSPTGTLIVCRDITLRKQIEEEREMLITELQEALASVKTLGGLLPICASCKKIRDDEGYWNQVDKYISKHTDAKFTHGICPDCAQKALSDYYKTKIEQGLE